MRFIYPNWEPAETDTTTIQIEKHFQQLSSEYGYKILPPESFVNMVGYEQLMSSPGKINDAIDLFKLNIENYPNSFNVYDSMGDAFAQKGDKGKAISNYQKAIELNTKSEITIIKLKALQNIK